MGCCTLYCATVFFCHKHTFRTKVFPISNVVLQRSFHDIQFCQRTMSFVDLPLSFRSIAEGWRCRYDPFPQSYSVYIAEFPSAWALTQTLWMAVHYETRKHGHILKTEEIPVNSHLKIWDIEQQPRVVYVCVYVINQRYNIKWPLS